MNYEKINNLFGLSNQMIRRVERIKNNKRRSTTSFPVAYSILFLCIRYCFGFFALFVPFYKPRTSPFLAKVGEKREVYVASVVFKVIC